MKPRVALALLLAAASAPALAGNAAPAPLRVCADPNDLPYSNAAREGFENRLVALLAADLGRPVEYVWWAQRRGNLRNTLNAGLCDVVPGVPSGLESVRTTRPYYRSSYVFVQRAGAEAPLRSLDDPRLARSTIGVQLVGDDGANTPPAHALAARGHVANVRGFPVYGDHGVPAPLSAPVDAVVDGRVDVAVVWGPIAGYFARHAARPLVLQPIEPWLDGPQRPMVFDISMAVRKEDLALRRALDAALERHRGEVEALLDEYGVPRIEAAADPGAD
jgi:mxaJ protein